MKGRNCSRAGATVFQPRLEKGERDEQEDG
jgi:hypothetical protein